ncbi:site-specific integrase [Alteromonas sp. Cnat2-8]|uniref:tyrosine-type recombinase/integrase n=1 Tax=Alteromonas sp. Cnat2-8 TaxID=2917728 RepID=UPI001EF3EC0D|nr:tyrosine-type recombinase/integrase [Alteromonas sp. Cnat2-8]MCG7654452.1 site-specific integrase [Alteromonas sp. Cnat2-8]
MSVKTVNGGYAIDFTINNKRYRETIPAPHNKKALQRIQDQEKVYRMAILLDDKAIADRFPSSKIIQKAFNTECNFTIHDYSNIWFKQKQRNWSHTTIRGYSQKYNRYIKPNWGHLKLTKFKASMFDEWASEVQLSPKSINETRNVLQQIFTRAVNDEVIEKNPASLIQRYKQQTKEPKPFSLFEINKILNALEHPYKEFFQFAFYTGLRTGELLGLRWQDIDFDKGVAHIRVNLTSGLEKEPKTKGSLRTVELHDEALIALKSLKNSDFFDNYRVFIDPKYMKEYKYADGLRKYVWKPTLEKLNIEYRYPYQCRHTYASMMLSSGKNPMWVAKQMGHADWGMIRKVYGRWLNQE